MHTLGKTERIKSSKEITALIQNGKMVSCYPFRIFWMYKTENATDAPVKAAFSVPRKKFKKAVVRNRIRRKTRESFRINKALVYQNLEKKGTLNLFFLYSAKQEHSYQEIERGMVQGLQRINKTLTKKTL